MPCRTVEQSLVALKSSSPGKVGWTLPCSVDALIGSENSCPGGQQSAWLLNFTLLPVAKASGTVYSCCTWLQIFLLLIFKVVKKILCLLYDEELSHKHMDFQFFSNVAQSTRGQPTSVCQSPSWSLFNTCFVKNAKTLFLIVNQHYHLYRLHHFGSDCSLELKTESRKLSHRSTNEEACGRRWTEDSSGCPHWLEFLAA